MEVRIENVPLPEIWLDVEADEVTQLTEQQIIELTRCGVRFDSNTESLAMFV